MLKFLVSLISALFLSIPNYGQKPALIFHHLSIQDGLSENSIISIVEDKKGFMWFASQDGLNKYDGYKFTVYKSNPEDSFSLTNSNVKLLFTDSKNRLWITTTNGVNIYDPLYDIFYNFRNNKYRALKGIQDDITGIIEDSQGRIWISTTDGLYCIHSLHQVPQKFTYPFKDESKAFSTLQQDTDTTLWVGCIDGLYKFNTVTRTFSEQSALFGSGYEVRKIYKDPKGNIWLCTSKGLKIIYQDGRTKEYHHDPDDPYSLYEDGIQDIIPYNGNFLIGTSASGLEYFEVRREKFHHYYDQLSSNNIYCVYKDSKGDLWVGTYLNGLNFSNPTTNLFSHVKNNFHSDRSVKKGIVTEFMKDRHGNLWITTDGGGVFRKNKGSETYINYTAGKDGLPSNVVIGIFEDPDGEIWISTYGAGLCRFNPKDNTFRTYRNDRGDSSSLFNDFTKDICYYNGKLWISGYDLGIGIYDKKTDKFENLRFDKSNPATIPSNWVQSFFIDRSGTLWLATFAGLSKYDSTTHSFKNFIFKSEKSINNTDINNILDIVEDSKGNFWLATMSNGIIMFNRENASYKVYTQEHGLSDNFTKSIIEDEDNNLWIATNDGITQWNLLTNKAKPYTIKDGAPSCAFHYNTKYKDEEGKIYFGANNGYIIINPKMTHRNKHLPPVVFTDFKIFNQSTTSRDRNSPLKYNISETREIILDHNQNSITLEFAALNFNCSKNNQFAYYLEGFDNSWFYVGTQRTATYTNLNPGTYTFRVKACNNDNIWNEGGVAVKIIINPPFWRTWWFVTMIIFFLILTLYLIYVWRTRIIRRENMLLDEMVKKRTSQLKEANEQLETFVYKASHDIKGPLKSIIGLTMIGKKDVLQGGDPIHYFEHILKSTSKLDNLILDLLTITKIKQADIRREKINFRELIAEVLDSFKNFPGYEKMEFYLDIKENADFNSDKKLLTSIIQNLIENAIKYSDETKPDNYLKMEIALSAKGAYMVFRDNGIGIGEEFIAHIFDMFFKANESSNGTGLGLFIVKTTVEKLNGSITVESDPGAGTTFYLKL